MDPLLVRLIYLVFLIFDSFSSYFFAKLEHK